MGFVVDARIALPDDVGLSIETVSFVTELKSPEGKEEHLFNSIDYQSPNYQEAEKKNQLADGGICDRNQGEYVLKVYKF